MFIVIEGLDGVGKTTAARRLAAKLQGEFFPWLHAPYRQALPLIWNEETVSEASKHLAFLAAFRHMSDIAGSASYRAKTIVTDRYYFCSLAMHQPLAALANETPLHFNSSVLACKKPDFAFYLALDEKSRRERLVERGEPLSPVELLLDGNPDLCKQIAHNYEKLAVAGEMIRIETDGLSRDEVVGAIVRKVEIGSSAAALRQPL
jgi:dTMP kinase